MNRRCHTDIIYLVAVIASTCILSAPSSRASHAPRQDTARPGQLTSRESSSLSPAAVTLPRTTVVHSREPLASTPYAPLPLGAVRPEGWLRTQLEVAASGLTGRLDEIYPNVGDDNAWRGGDGDAWERGPYWLDGLVPLAYILNDRKLIAKAQPWIEWILDSQDETGYFGPRPAEGDVRHDRVIQQGDRADWWPRMIILKVLQSYHEATGDERVIDFMRNYFRYQLATLPDVPLDTWTHWAKSRGGENQASVYWLYNRTGDAFLLDLATILFEQTRDWSRIFRQDPLPARHGVNTAMAIKQPAINFLQTRDPDNLLLVREAVRKLHAQHGQPTGMFSGDELLHGIDPTHGTELCTVVEFMYSLESLIGITGDTHYADLLEKVAYNALPAQITDDFMGRQYFQQPNQIRISREANRERNFMTNHDGLTNCFGLVNGYPCCTTNMHQGWPKLVKHLWYATPDDGLAALVYGTSTVRARVGSGEGVPVTIHQSTSYPFEETIRLEINTEREVFFPLHMRIPAWCDEASITVNGDRVEAGDAGSIVKLARNWRNGDVVTLQLPMRVRLNEQWPENAISIERGPLVYALHVEGTWKAIEASHGVPLSEVHPASAWNYGLILNRREPGAAFEIVQREAQEYPWTAGNAPIALRVDARRIPMWKEYNGSAGPLPHSPARASGDVEQVQLIPYGASVLRISVFPTVRE